MIIQEHQLIQIFEPEEGNKTAIYAFWVLHKAIIPYINNNSGKAFPGRILISQITKLSLPTVDKCLDYLAEQKIIEIEKRYDPKTKIHKTNLYSIETDLIKTVGNLKSNKTEEKIISGSQPSLQGVVNPVDKGSQPSLQGVVNPVEHNLQVDINLQEELTYIKNKQKANFSDKEIVDEDNLMKFLKISTDELCNSPKLLSDFKKLRNKIIIRLTRLTEKVDFIGFINFVEKKCNDQQYWQLKSYQQPEQRWIETNYTNWYNIFLAYQTKLEIQELRKEKIVETKVSDRLMQEKDLDFGSLSLFSHHFQLAINENDQFRKEFLLNKVYPKYQNLNRREGIIEALIEESTEIRELVRELQEAETKQSPFLQICFN